MGRLGLGSALREKVGPGLALVVCQGHCGAGAAPGRCLLDGAIDLGDAPVEVCHDAGLTEILASTSAVMPTGSSG
jgi:hypothetical protein